MLGLWLSPEWQRHFAYNFEGSELCMVCWSVSSTLNYIMERYVRIGKSCVLSCNCRTDKTTIPYERSSLNLIPCRPGHRGLVSEPAGVHRSPLPASGRSSPTVPTTAISLRICINSQVTDWEKTKASFEVSPACLSSEAVPQCLCEGWQSSWLAPAGQLSDWLKNIRGKLIMCQRSSAPTHIREVIQLSLWPERRLAGQATFTSSAVQLDARAWPSGVHKAGNQSRGGQLRGCLSGPPRVQGCLRACRGHWIDQGMPTFSHLLFFPPRSLSSYIPPSSSLPLSQAGLCEGNRRVPRTRVGRQQEIYEVWLDTRIKAKQR